MQSRSRGASWPTCRMGPSPPVSSLSRHSSMTRSVVFGTAAESLDGQRSRDYIARMIAQDGTVRWSWERVVPVMFETRILSFPGLGTVGLGATQGRQIRVGQPCRLTCFAV